MSLVSGYSQAPYHGAFSDHYLPSHSQAAFPRYQWPPNTGYYQTPEATENCNPWIPPHPAAYSCDAQAQYAADPMVVYQDPYPRPLSYPHPQGPPQPGEQHALEFLANGGVKVVKRRCSANKKERRRTISINTAFASLRGCIPNVPSDTKLSKIKTLKLATSYIAYLMEILEKDDPELRESDFKADLSRKTESREDRRKKEAEVGTTQQPFHVLFGLLRKY